MFSLAFQLPVSTPSNTFAIPSKTKNPFYAQRLEADQKRKVEQTFNSPITCSSLGTNRNTFMDVEPRKLPEGLLQERLPKHVAVNMDGNRRWALERGLPSYMGYECMRPKTKMLASLCADWGIKVCTLFWLSYKNWLRSKVEIDFLLRQCEEIPESDLEEYLRKGVKISIIGEKQMLPKTFQNLITIAEETTKHNTKLHLMLATSYGGRQDIIQAVKKIGKKIQDGVLSPNDIEELTINKELQTNCCAEFADPDLLIRTSGEQRISNFLLWQSTYTELFFMKKWFPDFQEPDFLEALLDFQQRHRRFGGHNY